MSSMNIVKKDRAFGRFLSLAPDGKQQTSPKEF
jgi:hypothetical protein